MTEKEALSARISKSNIENNIEKKTALIMEDMSMTVIGDEDADLRSIMKLTPRLQRFIHLYLTGLYTTSKLADLFDVHPNSILNWLNRADVKQAVFDVQKITHETITNNIASLSVKAIKRVGSLMDSPIDQVALSASKDILDRAGHKPQQNIKIDKTVRTFEEKVSSLIDETITDIDFEELEGDE